MWIECDDSTAKVEAVNSAHIAVLTQEDCEVVAYMANGSRITLSVQETPQKARTRARTLFRLLKNEEADIWDVMMS